VWPTNLIEGPATTVLLDWSFTGEGGLGEDTANLIVDSVADGLMDATLLPDIAASVTDGYIAGLRDGGWVGSADTVRRAIAARRAAKYNWTGPPPVRATSRHRSPRPRLDDDTTGAGLLLDVWAYILRRSCHPARTVSKGRSTGPVRGIGGNSWLDRSFGTRTRSSP
jgi:hypothetical protein